MAEKHTIPGTQVEVKPRHPVAVGFLSLTGVYIPFYWYLINKELKELGEARGIDLGTSPMTSALAWFPGGLVLAPPFVTAFTTTERIRRAQEATGRRDWLEGWIALLVLFMLAPMLFGLMQDQLNKVWQSLGLPTPNESPPLPPPPPGGYYGARAPQQAPQASPPPPGYRPPDAPPPA